MFLACEDREHVADPVKNLGMPERQRAQPS